MSEAVEEEKRQEALNALSGIIKEFLKGRYTNIMLRFDKPFYLNEDEYINMMGPIDASGGADDADVFFFVTDVVKDSKSEMCALTIKTLVVKLDSQEDNVYAVYEIRGHTNVKEIGCKEKEG